jgi:RNA polymerase sigma-70 factor, ECF subfamily
VPIAMRDARIVRLRPMRRAAPDSNDGFDAFDLREIVVEHRADIFRYARSLCRNDADAEDLAQTAVVRALASAAEVRNPERAKWYVLKIVRNLATDQARARARVAFEPWTDLPEPVSPDPAPDARLLHDDEHEIPRAAFADLPRVHQEVLHLRFVEELDHAAIAARLQTTEHAARQRVYRAMQALRELTRQRQLGLDNP